MSVSDKILELRTHREAIREAINGKGVDLAEGSPMSDYAGAINEISGGGISLKDYTTLTPEMISGTIGGGMQRYIGTATHLVIDDNFPTVILDGLFRDNQTLKSLVILTNKITSMRNTFYGIGSQLESLIINTSNVTMIDSLFTRSKAPTLDLSSFDVSKAPNMAYMFYNCEATSLELSSFDTSNVTVMASMFGGSHATTLDLSSFDMSKVTNTNSMFKDALATTGYARTQADADKLNASSFKPTTLNFIVKP